MNDAVQKVDHACAELREAIDHLTEALMRWRNAYELMRERVETEERSVRDRNNAELYEDLFSFW